PSSCPDRQGFGSNRAGKWRPHQSALHQSCREWGRLLLVVLSHRAQPCLSPFRSLLVAIECLGFAFVNVEDSQELRDRQQVLKFLGEIEQLELSAFFINGGVTGNQLTNAARIDVTHTRKIQQNTLLAFFEQTPDRGAQCHASLTDGYLSAHVKNGDVSGLTLVYIQLSHFRTLLCAIAN